MPLLACLAMMGCGEPPPPPEPRPVDQTVFKDQVEALDRARAVESALEERKRELEQELERYED